MAKLVMNNKPSIERILMGEENWKLYQRKRKVSNVQKFYARHPEKREIWNQKRKEFKLKAVEYKGGKCIKCNYDKCITALEFHHRNPSEKDFEISDTYTYNGKIEGKLKEELDKCDLYCCRCHREIHENLDNA